MISVFDCIASWNLVQLAWTCYNFYMSSPTKLAGEEYYFTDGNVRKTISSCTCPQSNFNLRWCYLFHSVISSWFYKSISGSLSLTSRKSFEACSGFPNCRVWRFLDSHESYMLSFSGVTILWILHKDGELGDNELPSKFDMICGCFCFIGHVATYKV